jgi:hypothetical protein
MMNLASAGLSDRRRRKRSPAFARNDRVSWDVDDMHHVVFVHAGRNSGLRRDWASAWARLHGPHAVSCSFLRCL